MMKCAPKCYRKICSFGNFNKQTEDCIVSIIKSTIEQWVVDLEYKIKEEVEGCLAGSCKLLMS